MDESMLNSFMDEEKKESKPELNISNEYIKSFELIMFTDGSSTGGNKTKKKQSGGSGIFTYSSNKFNNTKILKKLEDEVIICLDKSNNINYYSLYNNNKSEILCKDCGCNNIGYCGNTENKLYCSEHKQSSMVTKKIYHIYTPTNIRSEGFAILYSLMFIKIIYVDNITNKRHVYNKMKHLDILTSFSQLKKVNFNILNINKKFLIVTDSEFWINVITKWTNGWINKKSVMNYKNIDLILLINYYMNQIHDSNMLVTYQHIKGHSDKNKDIELNIYQKGNVLADTLAVHAGNMESYEITMT